jgi:hypothetical protein
MSPQRAPQLFEQLAAHLVPEDLDLRPAVRARIAPPQATVRASRYGQRRARSRTPMVLCLLALALAVGVPAAAVVTATTMRTQLQRFGVVLVDPTPAPTPATAGPQPVIVGPQSVPAAAATVTGSTPTWLSLEEARPQVPFPIRVPSWLPAGLTLHGALVGSAGAVDGKSGATKVILSYRATDGTTNGLHLDQIGGQGMGGLAVPAGQARTVTVNGRAAIYARGAWRRDETWDATADSGILSWEAEGFTYLVQFSGLGLSDKELIRIAESLR